MFYSLECSIWTRRMYILLLLGGLFCVSNRSSWLLRAVQVSHVLNCISACWILFITGRNSLTMMVLVYFVTQSCPLCDPMGCSPPGSSVHGILQARILEWLPCCSQRGSFQPRIEPRSPILQADSLPSQPPWFVYLSLKVCHFLLLYVDTMLLCI